MTKMTGPNDVQRLADVLGSDLVARMAQAAREHRVSISVHVMPIDEDEYPSDEENIDDRDPVQR